MAKKFSIKRDPTFTTTVNLPAPGHAPVPVSFTFKWMDRKSVASFQDDWFKFWEENKDVAIEEKWQNKKWAEVREPFEFDKLKSIISSWEIEEEFNDENLMALVQSSNELAAIIVRGYLDAYEKAREGN